MHNLIALAGKVAIACLKATADTYVANPRLFNKAATELLVAKKHIQFIQSRYEAALALQADRIDNIESDKNEMTADAIWQSRKLLIYGGENVSSSV